MICHFTATGEVDDCTAVRSTIVLFSVFATTMGNATVFATLGLFSRGLGLTEVGVGAIFASSALLFFLTSSQWGRLSDRFGRAPVIVVGLFGTAVSLFLFAGLYAMSWRRGEVAAAFAGLLAARMIYGLMAAGIQPAATAHMADATTDKKRPVGVALVGASVGVGSIIGPASAAALVGFGLFVPLVTAGVVIVLAGFAMLLSVREKSPRAMAASARAPTIRGLGSHMLLAFAIIFAFGALQSTTAFYVQDRFHLGTAMAIRQASLASVSFAFCSFFVQAFVIRVLPLGPLGMLASGFSICLLGIAGCLTAPNTLWLIAAFGVLGAGYGLAQSGLTAGVSVMGGDHGQGQIAGRLQAVMSAGWIMGALGGTAVYGFSIKAPLAVAATAMVLGAAAFVLITLVQRDSAAKGQDSGLSAGPQQEKEAA